MYGHFIVVFGRKVWLYFCYEKYQRLDSIFCVRKNAKKNMKKCLRKFCHMEKKTYICGIVLHNVWRVQRSHINDIIV